MDLELPEELRLLQASIRRFVDETLAPHEKEIEEKDEIPRALITAMGDAGLFGIGHDEKWGGQGFGKRGDCGAIEQAGRVTAPRWTVIGASAGLCGPAIEIGGPDEVRRRFLPEIFVGKKVGA